MKAFIFDPTWDELVTTELQDQLQASGLELIITKDIAPLDQNHALFEGSEERILCLNPDYVGWKLDSKDYSGVPNLKAILIASTAFSWVDATYANEQNIPICNIRNFSTEAVAEWAVLMMLNLARQTPRLIKDGFPLDFDKDFMKYRGVDLKGKTAGIIGLGHIGSAIAERAKGLGMNVVYWSHSKKEVDYSFVELNELIKTADVIFPTMALNDETKDLMTPELLNSLKSTAIFVSVVHGLFDETLLVEKVKSGKLFGFGFEAEPSSFNNYDGNVWAAPAYGWVTDGSMLNSMTMWVENMTQASLGQYPNRVN